MWEKVPLRGDLLFANVRIMTHESREECAKCGETLVRVFVTGNLYEDYREEASNQKHDCWLGLPEDAEHLRLD